MSEKQVWEIIKDFNCADLKIVAEPATAVWNSQQVTIDELQKKLRDIESAMKKFSDAVEANECSDCCEHYFALEEALRGSGEVDLDS